MATFRKRGDKWQVQIRRSDTPPVSRTFHQRKDAEAWARQKELQADRQELPTDTKILQQVTLGELVKRYRDEVTTIKKGRDVERIVLNAFLSHPICKKRLSEISATDFANYRDERLTRVKPATVKRQLAPIRNLFALAKDEWGLPLRTNPFDTLRLHVVDRRRERRLVDDELRRLIYAAKACRNDLVGPIMKLALQTGMRRGELLALTWDDLNLTQRSLLIRDAKNGEGRIIPLTRAAVGILAGVPRTEEQVFPMTANAFRLSWERLVTRAGILDLHFHDLRHEAISCLFEQGLTTPEVALISGHKDIRMLFRYAHAARETILHKFDASVKMHSMIEFT